eukprot:SAG31_NODE_462_length_15340_cov_2.972968_9_plen_67_part_00
MFGIRNAALPRTPRTNLRRKQVSFEVAALRKVHFISVAEHFPLVQTRTDSPGTDRRAAHHLLIRES